MHSLAISIHLLVCLRIMDPHSRAPKKNTSYGNEVLPQDTTHLIQRSCYQQGSPCQDPAGNWTTRRQPDDRKETQTAGVWTCLLFIRSGQNHPSGHLGQWTTPWSVEEMLDGHRQRVDIFLPMTELLTRAFCSKDWKRISAE